MSLVQHVTVAQAAGSCRFACAGMDAGCSAWAVPTSGHLVSCTFADVCIYLTTFRPGLVETSYSNCMFPLQFWCMPPTHRCKAASQGMQNSTRTPSRCKVAAVRPLARHEAIRQPVPLKIQLPPQAHRGAYHPPLSHRWVAAVALLNGDGLRPTRASKRVQKPGFRLLKLRTLSSTLRRCQKYARRSGNRPIRFCRSC